MVDALFRVPPLIVYNHVGTQQRCTQTSSRSESCSSRQRRDVLWRILWPEDVRTNDTHQVCQRHTNRGKGYTPVLVGDVVVVPCGEENGRCRCTPCHHEAGEVGNGKGLFYVNGGVDDEADECEQKAESDEREAETSKVRGKSQDEKNNCSNDVGRYSIKVRLDVIVS